MNLEQLAKLQSLRQELDPTNSVPVYEEEETGVVFVEADRKQIRDLLLEQHENNKAADFTMEEFEELTGPASEEVVEVSYYDGVIKVYVDISLDNFDKNITEEQYLLIRQNLRAFAREPKKVERQSLLREIAEIGPDAVEVIFRECRQFDLVEDEVRAEVIDVIAQLAYRHLNARLLIKGILEHSTSASHTYLAIGVAGALRDEEAIPSLLKHVYNGEYFKGAFDALLKIRNVHSVEGIVQSIEALDIISQKHLMDYAISQAKRFKKFGPDAIDVIFNYYENGVNRSARKVYIDAMCAFGEDAIPHLLKGIEHAKQAHDLKRLSQICMTLGSLRIPESTDVLKRALNTSNDLEKRAIITGLGRSADDSVMDIILYEFQQTDDYKLKSECINALSFFRGKSNQIIEIVKPYANDTNKNIHLDALACLARFGQHKYLEDLISYALDGAEREQEIAQFLIARLPMSEITNVGRRLLNLPDEKALKIVMILQRVNRLPRELAPVVQEKLKGSMVPLLEMEIYRLIAKHVNVTPPFLPAEVLFEARRQSTNDRITRELSNMISNIANRSGVISTND